MDEKTTELVGIAASIAGHCRPCFDYHYKRAVELGVSKNDIDAAIDLAKRIGESGNRQMSEYARDLIGGNDDD